MRVVSSRKLSALLACAAAIVCVNAEFAVAQSSSQGSSSRRVQPGTSSRRVQQGSGTQSGSSNQSSGSGTAKQGSGTTRQQGSSSRKSSRGSFEAKLWTYLQAQKYKNWAPVPGKSDAAYPGQSPHGAFLKMYLNRTAAGSPRELPDRSIIIKENLAEDGKTLGAITVMYRSKGYNPEAGDWYWIKYNPDGSVATTPPDQGSMMLSGRPNGCIECHGGADGSDFAFFNDGL